MLLTLKKKKWKWTKCTATWNRFVLQLFVELEVWRVRHSSSFVDDEVCCSRSHLNAVAEENRVREGIDRRSALKKGVEKRKMQQWC